MNPNQTSRQDPAVEESSKLPFDESGNVVPALSLRGKKGFQFFGNDGTEQAVLEPAGLIFLHRGLHSRRVLQDGVRTSAPDMPTTSISAAGRILDYCRAFPCPMAEIMFRG